MISGCIGPEGDGYAPETMLTPDEAERYHAVQIGTFADTAADMVTAITMTYAEEAIGVTRAAAAVGLPAVISFTLETDGRLPSGQALGGAIQQVDDATDGAPAYYMINCAHPTHFEDAVAGGEPWVQRIGGLRTNASTKSHAELDEAEELDEGDPADLAERHAALKATPPGRERPRRLLRHRPPPRRRDLRRVARRRTRANVENRAHEGLGEGGLRAPRADRARGLAARLREGGAARDARRRSRSSSSRTSCSSCAAPRSSRASAAPRAATGWRSRRPRSASRT